MLLHQKSIIFFSEAHLNHYVRFQFKIETQSESSPSLDCTTLYKVDRKQSCLSVCHQRNIGRHFYHTLISYFMKYTCSFSYCLIV